MTELQEVKYLQEISKDYFQEDKELRDSLRLKNENQFTFIMKTSLKFG